MKKEYVRPESHLFMINLTENIADQSGGIADGGDIGYKPIPGKDGLYYTGIEVAEVKRAPYEMSYKEELDYYVNYYRKHDRDLAFDLMFFCGFL